ncbi:FKBP-type peptidyl-prolyl cis-trans isomerase [Roseimarinus sediminis]|uniref:FKBP-type peptidyl-prolyl cis-trans isomerase n=1 Tax=Roseimarinus sediminis TaxID=1610899 RepID=UPI003D23E1D4
MKRTAFYIISLLIALFSMAACDLNNNDAYEEYQKEWEAYQKKVQAQYQADSLLISDYLAEHDSVAEIHEASGIFYHIIAEGESQRPDIYSIVEVSYKGMLLDGTVFDQTDTDMTATFQLSNLIKGWQVGIPLIGTDGKIILYLPSYYGYGESESKTIPANSVLIFEVDLHSFY